MNQYFSFNKFAALFTAVFMFFIASAAAQVVLISPANQTAKQGDTVSVKVNVENFTGLKVYSIKVSYNVNVLKCISVSRLDFLSAQTSTFFFTMVDSVAGRVQCDEAILGTGSSSGSGGLFEMKFIGKNLGVSPMDFFSLDLRNIDNQQLTYTHQNGTLSVQTTSGLNDDPSGPEEFILYPNFPNPFNPATNIKFNLSADSRVTMEVFNMLGEKVATLLNGSVASGTHSVNFAGDNLQSGIYVCRLSAGNQVRTIKMSLSK